MATIALEGIRFYAYHGFYEEENIIGQEYELDVMVQTEIEEAAMTDDLFSSVNYETVYRVCQVEMKKPAKLLETVVVRIAARLHRQFDTITGVKVKLRNLHPPLGGRVAAASVEHATGVFNGGEGLDEDLFSDLFGDL